MYFNVTLGYTLHLNTDVTMSHTTAVQPSAYQMDYNLDVKVCWKFRMW